MTAARGYRTALATVLGCAVAGWLLGGCAFAAAALAGEAPKIKIGTEGTYRPFSYFSADGKLTGFDVELALAICKAAGLDCEMVTLDFDGMIPALNERKIDGIDAGVVITPKFKKVVALTDPIRSSGKRFVSCTPNASPDVSPAGLKGRTIGTQGNTSSADYFDTYYKGEDIRLYKSMDEAYQDLTAGRVDLVLSQEGAAYGFISSPSGKGCSFVGPRVNDPRLFGAGVGIAVRKDDAQLTAALNAGIRKVLADGTYKALNAKYFPFSVY
jgi:ABC-type amino acid transport substrate-binding protein